MPARFVRIAGLFAALAVLLPGVALAQASPPQPPVLPDVTPIAVDPTTTAFLVLDINSAVCPSRPACVASVPSISRLLGRARAAGMFVGFSSTAGAEVLPDVAPRDGEPVVTARADKFFNTTLDQILKDHAIQTVVLVGAAANGAVLYTSFGANERGYTVAVATDGISSGPDFDTYLAEYQILNQPGFSNPTNDPLHANAATLTRSDLISFNPTSK
jgi:nicotinamidase-related amidase